MVSPALWQHLGAGYMPGFLPWSKRLVTEAGAAITDPAIVSQHEGRSARQNSVTSPQALWSHSSFSLLTCTTVLMRLPKVWKYFLSGLDGNPDISAQVFRVDCLLNTHSSAIKSLPFIPTPQTHTSAPCWLCSLDHFPKMSWLAMQIDPPYCQQLPLSLKPKVYGPPTPQKAIFSLSSELMGITHGFFHRWLWELSNRESNS